MIKPITEITVDMQVVEQHHSMLHLQVRLPDTSVQIGINSFTKSPYKDIRESAGYTTSRKGQSPELQLISECSFVHHAAF